MIWRKENDVLWCSMSTVCLLQCGGVITWSIFTKKYQQRHPIVRPLGQKWGVFCRLKMWCIFSRSHLSDVRNIMLYWTTSLRHPTVYRSTCLRKLTVSKSLLNFSAYAISIVSMKLKDRALTSALFEFDTNKTFTNTTVPYIFRRLLIIKMGFNAVTTRHVV